MIELLVYWFACYGLTFTLCDAKILARPRRFLVSKSQVIRDLLGCYFCTGFWVSGGLYLALFPQPQACLGMEDQILWFRVVWTIGFALAGATISYFLNALIEALEASSYALHAYTGKFEAIVQRVREQEREQGLDPDAPEDEDDD